MVTDDNAVDAASAAAAVFAAAPFVEERLKGPLKGSQDLERDQPHRWGLVGFVECLERLGRLRLPLLLGAYRV